MSTATHVSKPASRKKSWLKRANDWFHLWIGIVTGIPIVIISITGCALVFEQEITHALRPYWHIESKAEAALLPPSVIRAKVMEQLPELEVRKLWYYGLDAPVKITPENSDSLVFVNPYTGKVLAQEDHENFFHFILEGHTQLWLPDEVGHQVVSWTTAIFLVLLLTGVVLWWPKKWDKRNREQAFSIQWKASLKRVNYDLHNVLGFYCLVVALLMTLTGLVMGFPFIRTQVYQMLGGTTAKRQELTFTTKASDIPAHEWDAKMDAIWRKTIREIGEKDPYQISLHYPKPEATFIYACTDMMNGNWRELYFDMNTLALLPTTPPKVSEDTAAKWMMRSNYGIHVGSIGGTLTKVIYFLSSFICATLPITGFYVWWGKRKKKPVKRTIRVSRV